MALTPQALTLIRGDSKNWRVTITDTASPANPINLDQDLDGNGGHPAVLKFSTKVDPRDPNNVAVILKTSYYPEDVEILDQGAFEGQALVKVVKDDTWEAEVSSELEWDIELYRQGEAIVGGDAGTIEVTAGSGTVEGTGTDFALAKVGDILVPAGATAPNQKPVTVTEVVSTTELVTDYTAWTSEAAVSYALRKGDSKTVAKGTFDLQQDQTT